MDAIDLIIAKRDGGRLSDEQVDWFIRAYTDGTVADEQASALLMAILFRGMEPAELARWTQQMIATGARADLSDLPRPTVDKHSTGGVGDKISLILVPLVAACGAAVPQIAGRGLGHTGGTLDKLESIAGYTTQLPADRYRSILTDVGCVIAGASGDIAPADRKLYALRDVTATVESIPLISSSIMSKKIAGGTSSLDTQASLHCRLALRAVDAARGSVATAATVALEHGPTSSTLVLDGQGTGAGWQGVAEASELALKPLGGDSATLNYVAQLSYRQDQARVEARGVGLNIERRYSVLRDGRWQALSGTSARRGEWIRVTLQLQVPALRHFVAITDTVPGGWATRDVGLAGVAGANVREVANPGSWWFDTRQTGATEVRLYAESLPPGTREVHYFAQAQHPGRYFAPPAVAELMYGRASRANTAGDWVEIQP